MEIIRIAKNKITEFLWGAKALLKLKKDKPLLVVYQMGKVGSKSMQMSLKKQYAGVVFHTHVIRHDHKNPSNQLLYQEIKINNRPTKIITMIREPFARNESSFFEIIERFYPNKSWSTATADELCKCYIEKYHHYEVALWFDWEFRTLTGVDIYDQPLIEGDHIIGKHENIEYCLLYCETSNKRKEDIINKFLSMDNFSIKDENKAENKPYNKLYREFKENIIYPESILDYIYDSKYSQHFYPDRKKPDKC